MHWNKIKREIKDNSNSLIILGVVLILIVSYLWFFPGFDDPLFRGDTRTGADEIGVELILELNRLKDLDSVDLSILEDPILSEMSNISRDIPVRPTGRTNPFAPF